MKKTFLLTIYLLISLLSWAQTAPFNSSLNDFDLKGSINKVKIMYYKAIMKFDTLEKGELTKVNILTFEKSILINEEEFSGEGNLMSKTKYSYDNNNSLKKIIYIDSEGNIISVIKLSYLDSSNTLKVQINIEMNGLNIATGFVSINNSEGLKSIGVNSILIGKNVIIQYDSTNKKEITYNFNNNWKLQKLEITYYNEKMEKSIVKKFSKKLYLIEELTYKYEYDSNGNWIKRIEYRNGIPHEICEREISYF